MITQQDIEAAEKLNFVAKEGEDERIAAALALARQNGAEAMQKCIAAKFDEQVEDAKLSLRVAGVNDRNTRRRLSQQWKFAEDAAKMVRGVTVGEVVQ